MFSYSRSDEPEQLSYPKRNLGVSFLNLLLDEREEGHETCALYSSFYGPLLLGGETALGASHDATVRIDELLEQVDIFVVDVLDVILCEYVCHMILYLNFLEPSP